LAACLAPESTPQPPMNFVRSDAFCAESDFVNGRD
jgi:hypothetical protein